MKRFWAIVDSEGNPTVSFNGEYRIYPKRENARHSFRKYYNKFGCRIKEMYISGFGIEYSIEQEEK